jgi:hypothetical protein
VTVADRPFAGSWALVASGDKRLRDRARVGLGGAGMFCDDAATARAALDHLESLRHDYAVVVIDMDLPGGAPHEIEGTAAATVPAADIIRCGLPGAGSDAARGAWLAKPVHADEFARVVHALRAAT